MDEILSRKYSTKAFFSVLIPSLLVLICLRYWVLPPYSEEVKTGIPIFFSNLADGIIVSSLVTVLIGLFLYFLKPEEVKKAKIEIVEPRALTELFEKAFPSTDIWWYKGGCGRYFRTKSLPEMAGWARRSSSAREIRAVILDPLNTDLCETHAIFRKSTASASLEQRSWDLNKVRNELYATIVTALVLQREEPMLSIKLSLASHYSAFRIDLSDDYAIITKEDRKAPAIFCNSESYYYKSYKDEIVLSEKQCRNVPELSSGDYSLEVISAQQVGDILEAVELKYAGMGMDAFEEIASLCREKVNPYA